MPTAAPDRIVPAPRAGLLVVTAALFTLSGGVLWILGLNYDGLTGAAASKVHPATYVATLLIVWQMMASGNPAAYVAAVVRRWPATMAFLAVVILLFMHVVLTAGHNLAGTIDTFLLPILLVVLTTDLDDKVGRQIELLIHGLLIANAVVALVEFAVDVRFFPYVLDGEILPTDTRSNAFGGHPLANATITAIYILVLLSGAGAALRGIARTFVVLLELAALVAFGGRSALIVTLLLGGTQVASVIARRLRRGRVSLPAAALVAVALPTIAGAGSALAATGFFTPLLDRFLQEDGGSAQARVLMFDLLQQVSWRDLFVGPDPAYIDAIRLTSGLELGIENPVVSFLLYHGIIVTALLLAGFGLFMFEAVRRRARGTAVPVLGFLLLINTFEGLASKSVLLAKVILMIVAFYPPRASSAAASRASR